MRFGRMFHVSGFGVGSSLNLTTNTALDQLFR